MESGTFIMRTNFTSPKTEFHSACIGCHFSHNNGGSTPSVSADPPSSHGRDFAGNPGHLHVATLQGALTVTVQQADDLPYHSAMHSDPFCVLSTGKRVRVSPPAEFLRNFSKFSLFSHHIPHHS